MKPRIVAFSFFGLVAASLASPAWPQNVDATRTVRAADVLSWPVPVTAADIGDRPYRVIGRIDTYVGKPLWQSPPAQDKIFRELWERARRLGADAVVHATFGSPQCELFRSCGGRAASGEAIHFLTPTELTAQPQR